MTDQQSILHIQPLSCDAITIALQNLPHIGIVNVMDNGFSYIDIDDGFIHDLYPLLQYPGIKKPDYFDADTHHIGAHISLTYPEENTLISSVEAGRYIGFQVAGLFFAELGNKRYFALRIKAPDLLKIRHRYGLTDKLQLKGYLLEPHITIAITKIYRKTQAP